MSISSATSASSSYSTSPLDRLKQELAKEVSSGQISSTDETALSSALDDIDSAMKSGASSAASGSGGSPPSPEAMQSKINDLIQNEVSSGKLTSDQASELKSVFANTFSGGPGSSADAGGTSSSSSDSSSSTASSSSSDTDKLLQELLQALQSSMGQGASSYNGSGASASSGTANTSLLLNYTS